jgi:hypothetical protein
MTICDLCSGSHVTSACVIGRAHVRACVMSRTSDDYRPAAPIFASNVIPLFPNPLNHPTSGVVRSIDRKVAAG